ncbi:MAG: hypothetical protein MSD82_11680 [Prevotella sp.]|nr:hypothetical protein [Prevotella sp.]
MFRPIEKLILILDYIGHNGREFLFSLIKMNQLIRKRLSLHCRRMHASYCLDRDAGTDSHLPQIIWLSHGNRHEMNDYGLGRHYVRTMTEHFGGNATDERAPGKRPTFKLRLYG